MVETPEATTSDASQRLREEGNVAFRSSQWEKASKRYSEALEAAPATAATDEEEEHQASLYSNRAAARIQLFQFDLALLDAASACQLKPKWSRAQIREAEAFHRLHAFEEARDSYALATDLAEDDPTRSRYMAASASALSQLQQQQKESSVLDRAEASLTFAARYDKYIKDGGDPEKDELTSAATAVFAWTIAEKAFERLDEELDVNEAEEVEAATPSPVLDLADAIITDPRGFHIPKGKSDKLPLSEKLRIQLSCDAKILEIDQFIRADVVPRDVIDYFDEQVRKEGWQKAKVALAHLIRGSFVAAYVNEIQAQSSEAASQYRFVLGLLQQGRERWKDVEEEEKGSTFRFTFERKVKVHLIEALVDSHFRSIGTNGEDEDELQEAQNLAEEVMDDCAREKAPSDAVSTFAFQGRPLSFRYSFLPRPAQLTPPLAQTQPVVAAGKAFAYALRQRAGQSGNRLDFAAGFWIHPGMIKACAKMYGTAGALLPEDDPEKAVNLFNSLAFDLRGGGLTIATLFSRAAAAEAALVPCEGIFGPSSRLFDSRRLVRSICGTARSHLTQYLTSIPSSAYETVLRAAPTVFKEKIPEGGKWEGLVDEEIWEKYVPGELVVPEVVSLPVTKTAGQEGVKVQE